jgi:hypothetical protein
MIRPTVRIMGIRGAIQSNAGDQNNAKIVSSTVDGEARDIDLLLVVEFIPTESCKFKGIPFCLVHALHVSRQTQT